MSREKQIVEMVTDIRKVQHGGWKFICESEYTTDVFNEELAEHLFTKGYCKRSEWISVEDRLPESDGKYLVCTQKQKVFIARFYEGVFCCFSDESRMVTHWMELPEPPKM